ncbi:unnamed protein product [Phytophthora fragariaefolia]|uniref:Unnamed protein product n=1 Tax=Phytophthora fragariaefolia TaxID=1490495 RepID=A0A9W7CW72_9STRA|nr:unnamed protein product [Phytophthora fragariaefolia]
MNNLRVVTAPNWQEICENKKNSSGRIQVYQGLWCVAAVHPFQKTQREGDLVRQMERRRRSATNRRQPPSASVSSDSDAPFSDVEPLLSQELSGGNYPSTQSEPSTFDSSSRPNNPSRFGFTSTTSNGEEEGTQLGSVGRCYIQLRSVGLWRCFYLEDCVPNSTDACFGVLLIRLTLAFGL